MSETYCISFDDVKAAARRIEGTAHRTPVLTSASIDELAKCRVYFKVEAMQKTGSFKFRGALNAVRSVLEENEQQGDEPLQVLTHSSGNHAQALALAAKLSCTSKRHVKATIVMPENAPDVKRQAVMAFGGIPVMTENSAEARERVAEEIRQRTGATFLHPSADPRVIAGQGTACLELYEQVKEIASASAGKQLDTVIIPVGGGGLAAGNTIALRALYGTDVRIVLAEPEQVDDAYRSFHGRTLVGHPSQSPQSTVADGLKTTLDLQTTWPIVRDLVDDIITVSEREILVATKLIWERLKVCIEPSAGVGVAVLMSKKFRERYGDTAGSVGVILCGGNVDVIQVAQLMKEMGI